MPAQFPQALLKIFRNFFQYADINFLHRLKYVLLPLAMVSSEIRFGWKWKLPYLTLHLFSCINKQGSSAEGIRFQPQ